jgi:xanthine dehydrogenase accessory factor
MNDTLLDELAAARQSRIPCALVTVVNTRGSVPRAAGSKMLVYYDGQVSGTIGGGKFESLVIAKAQEQMREKKPLLKSYSLHESSPESFGAICGGESTVFIEPQILGEGIFLIGAGHCSSAIAKLAVECGLFVTAVDDRAELASGFPPSVRFVTDLEPADFVAKRTWQSDDALIIVSRNHQIDRDALAAALRIGEIRYIGMIGSKKKVQHVFDQLIRVGLTQEQLDKVYAPIGLDIGADSPAEIATSVVAEVLSVLRGRSGDHLRAADERG